MWKIANQCYEQETVKRKSLPERDGIRSPVFDQPKRLRPNSKILQQLPNAKTAGSISNHDELMKHIKHELEESRSINRMLEEALNK